MTNITLSALKQGASEITVASTADPTVTARIPAIISPADQATPVKLTDGMWSLPGDGGDGLTLAKAYRPGRWHGDQLTDEYLASGKASMDEWLDWVAEHFNAGTPLPVDNTGACSALTAYAPDAKGWVAGRNMDWGVGVAALLYRLDPEHGHASLNVAAVPSNAKNGIPTAGELAAAAACAPWLAMDGINDAGLMAACLQVGRYTAPGSGTRIAQMGLVRILLDKAGSVDEAVTLAQSLDPAEFGGSWSALGGFALDRRGQERGRGRPRDGRGPPGHPQEDVGRVHVRDQHHGPRRRLQKTTAGGRSSRGPWRPQAAPCPPDR